MTMLARAVAIGLISVAFWNTAAFEKNGPSGTLRSLAGVDVCEAPSLLEPLGQLTFTGGDVPALAWTGTEYGVVWSDTSLGSDLQFARFAGNGERIGDLVRLTNAPGQSVQPALVWTGEYYGLAWMDQFDAPGVTNRIYFMRLNPSGTPIAGQIRVTDTTQAQRPSLAWTGSEFALAWEDYTVVTRPQVYFQRLALDGSLIDSAVLLTDPAASNSTPVVVWSGSGFGIAWAAGIGTIRRVRFAHLDALGNRVGSDIQVANTSANTEYPSLVWTGTDYGLTWTDFRAGLPPNYYFARIDAGGVLIGAESLIAPFAVSYGHTLAWTGVEFGCAYESAINPALCANVPETPTPIEFSVEGGEAEDHGVAQGVGFRG